MLENDADLSVLHRIRICQDEAVLNRNRAVSNPKVTWLFKTIIASVFQIDVLRETPHPSPLPLGEGWAGGVPMREMGYC